MALPATIVWEVRPATATSADNGGGFDSAKIGTGTDRSQQAGVQVNIDDAAITCTTPAANSNVLTFTAGYSPAAVDEGNTVAITAGTNINAGLYVINSVVVGTSWTLAGATNLTTAGGAGSAITGKMGGARTGFSTGTTTLQSKVLAGHYCWIQQGAWNEQVAITASGSAGTPIVLEGYKTVRGDGTTLANRPVNDRAAAASNAFNSNVVHIVHKHLVAKSCGGTKSGFLVATQNYQTFINCRATANGGKGFEIGSISPGNFLYGCEADGNASSGFLTNGANHVACVSRGNTGNGFVPQNNNNSYEDCIAFGNSLDGFVVGVSFPVLISGCIADGNGSDGVSTGTAGPVIIVNTICSNNTAYGINATASVREIFADYNDVFGNGTAGYNGLSAGAHDLALDPQFADRANGDFSIGTNLRGAGWPGAFNMTSAKVSTGYPDIGAVQRSETAAVSAAGSAPYPLRG